MFKFLFNPLVLSSLFVAILTFMVSVVSDTIGQRKAHQLISETPIQAILMDDAYYFPHANNPHITPSAGYNPDLAYQGCQSKQITNMRFLYKNGSVLMIDKDGVKIFKENKFYSIDEPSIIYQKFGEFCRQHFGI